MRGPGKWAVLLVLFAALVLADQCSKFLAVDRLTTAFATAGDDTLGKKLRGFYGYRHLEYQASTPYTVWAPMWRMAYVENPAGAFSLFRDASPGVRNAFFVAVALAAIAFILGYYRKLRDDQRYYQVALALVLAGAVGNFIDRLVRHYVIDFIDWYYRGWHWPTFNVADSLIVVGVALLVLHPGQRKAVEPEGASRQRSA